MLTSEECVLSTYASDICDVLDVIKTKQAVVVESDQRHGNLSEHHPNIAHNTSQMSAAQRMVRVTTFNANVYSADRENQPLSDTNANQMYNSSPDGETQHFTDATFGSRSPSESEQLIPFRCSADIIGLDGSGQELSISLLLNIAMLGSERFNDGHRRSLCRITAERFEARIASLDQTTQTDLRMQELRITMQPSMDGFQGAEQELERYQRSFDAISQMPTLTNIAMKESSLCRERGFSLRFGYPQGVSVEGSN